MHRLWSIAELRRITTKPTKKSARTLVPKIGRPSTFMMPIHHRGFEIVAQVLCVGFC